MIPLQVQILIALTLDYLLGDPAGWPHPVRWMGRWASAYERRVRFRMSNERLAGILGVVGLLLVTGLTAAGLLWILGMIHPLLADGASIIMLWTTLAVRDLAVHSRRVHQALARGDLLRARQAVGMLVGRETSDLDSAQITRACVESVAENSVDGVIAPLFFGFIFGPVGALLYKAVNTLDSMWGYTTGGYRHFGRAAARLDDVLNWVPARLGALALFAAGWMLRYPLPRAWFVWKRDRGKHLSPNGGQSEAAMAGLLGVQLGGENRYHGQVSTRPRMGDPTRPVHFKDILAANRLMHAAVLLTLALMTALHVCV